MFSYVYKPVTVQAVQYSSLQGDITSIVPSWLMKAIIDKRIYVSNSGTTILNKGVYQFPIEENDWIVFDPEVDAMWVLKDSDFKRLFEENNHDAKRS